MASTAKKPAFKKNDQVVVINDWDRKGTVTIRYATIHSCGLKRLILTDNETGREFGQELRPVKAEGDAGGVYDWMDADAAEATALQLAERILEREREHFARCLAGSHGANYDAAITKQRDELHEPRFLYHHEAQAQIRAAIAARNA